MNSEIKNHIALITGGATGIGFGIAKSLAGEGVNLAIASRNPRKEAVEELKNYGIDVLPIKTDVSEEHQVVKMVAQAIEHFGHVDYYINNAARTLHEPITQITTKAWNTTINTNLSSCVWACREISRHMIKRKQGGILIIGSTATLHPLYKETSYRVSKTGLRAYMEVLAIELAPYRIRVNMIIPGPFKTPMTEDFYSGAGRNIFEKEVPMGRIGSPEECGPAAVFLLSDKLSSYTTAATLVIDGGLRLRPHNIYTESEILEMNAPD